MTENIYDEKPVCIIEVNENLRRVRAGMELTRPLAQLNRTCGFQAKYDEAFDIWEADKIKEEKQKETHKRNQKYKSYNSLYCKRPYVKAKLKAYNQKPEVKRHKRKILLARINKNPEKFKRLRKEYYQKNKVKIAAQRKKRLQLIDKKEVKK